MRVLIVDAGHRVKLGLEFFCELACGQHVLFALRHMASWRSQFTVRAVTIAARRSDFPVPRFVLGERTESTIFRTRKRK